MTACNFSLSKICGISAWPCSAGPLIVGTAFGLAFTRSPNSKSCPCNTWGTAEKTEQTSWRVLGKDIVYLTSMRKNSKNETATVPHSKTSLFNFFFTISPYRNTGLFFATGRGQSIAQCSATRRIQWGICCFAGRWSNRYMGQPLFRWRILGLTRTSMSRYNSLEAQEDEEWMGIAEGTC